MKRIDVTFVVFFFQVGDFLRLAFFQKGLELPNRFLVFLEMGPFLGGSQLRVIFRMGLH